ncbi:MAG: YafY family protein [Cyclobacteriaceae bacterium]
MQDLEKPRLSRLTELITLLQSRKMITAPFLADKFGVSVRTIYRDIRTLEKSGIPIITEEGKGYKLMDGYQLPPVMFTEEEANAIITASQIIATNKDRSFAEHYENAVTKIRSVLRYSQKEKADLLTERIQYRENAEKKRSSDFLMAIQSAITAYRLTDIIYESLNGKRTVRTVEPFAIYSTQGNWLLIAYCRLRNEFRAFRIDHIRQLTMTDRSFEPHPMTLEEYFIECRKNYLTTPDTGLS